MSPNLSSQHFPPNRLLYEQVIFNVLKLIGIIPSGGKNSVGYSGPHKYGLTVF